MKKLAIALVAGFLVNAAYAADTSVVTQEVNAANPAATHEVSKDAAKATGSEAAAQQRHHNKKKAVHHKQKAKKDAAKAEEKKVSEDSATKTDAAQAQTPAAE